MERMFERDKDELRELGVIVEVLPTDVYFDDELGYQIIPRDFFLPEISFTFAESMWLTIATNLLQDLALDESAKLGLQKLVTFSTGGVEAIRDIGNSSPFALPAKDDLIHIWRSIRDKRVLRFTYRTIAGESVRKVSPVLLTSRIGNWYLVAKDAQDGQVKTFRIDRISGLHIDNIDSYDEISSQFDLHQFLKLFKGDVIDSIKLRLHRALSQEHPLLSRASSNKSAQPIEPGSIVTLENLDRNHAVEMILWAGDAVEVLEPITLREHIIDVLERTIEVNS